MTIPELAQRVRPRIDGEGGIYVVSWEDRGVALRFERLSEARDTVTAEVTIRTMNPVSTLYWGRLNLLTVQGRRPVVKQLEERYMPVEWRWDNVVEQACLMVMERHREGEPVVLIGNLPPQEQEEYCVFPFIKEGQANLLFGPGGIGKSNLACLLALLAQTGFTCAGINAHAEPVNVLYLDYESSKEDLDERIRALRAGLELPEGTEIAYRYCAQALAHDIEEITRQVLERRIGLVIVDSLGTACGGAPEEADSILRYFSALRSLKVSTLTISHTNKEGKLFGSVYTWNQARNIFEVRGNPEEDSAQAVIGLYHVKINRGRKVKPLALRFVFNDDLGTVGVGRADILDIPVLEEGVPLHARIAHTLERGASSVKDLAETLGAPEPQIRQALNRGRDKQFLAFPGAKNLWGNVHRNGDSK